MPVPVPVPAAGAGAKAASGCSAAAAAPNTSSVCGCNCERDAGVCACACACAAARCADWLTSSPRSMRLAKSSTLCSTSCACCGYSSVPVTYATICSRQYAPSSSTSATALATWPPCFSKCSMMSSKWCPKAASPRKPIIAPEPFMVWATRLATVKSSLSAWPAAILPTSSTSRCACSGASCKKPLKSCWSTSAGISSATSSGVATMGRLFSSLAKLTCNGMEPSWCMIFSALSSSSGWGAPRK